MRDAIHVAPFANSSQTLLGWFEMCTFRLNFTYLVESTIPYHMANIEAGEPSTNSYMRIGVRCHSRGQGSLQMVEASNLHMSVSSVQASPIDYDDLLWVTKHRRV